MDKKQAQQKLAKQRGLMPLYSTPSSTDGGGENGPEQQQQQQLQQQQQQQILLNNINKVGTNGRSILHHMKEEINGEELVVVDDDEEEDRDTKESSSSGSSDSGSSSSSGEDSSSSSSAESSSHPSSSVWKEDEVGEFILVTCAENEAKFYRDRFARGSIGRCVWFKGRWITPNEFQAISGRQSSKDWKRSIRLHGRCLKEYISEGLFQEHLKTCTCKICQGEDNDLRRQEGVMALAAKRRRLSQAGVEGSHGNISGSGPSHTPSHQTIGEHDVGGGDGAESAGDSEGGMALVEGVATAAEKLPGSEVKRRKRGRPPKNQRVWSPSGEVAQEASSNEEEYRPDKMPSLIPDSESMEAVIDASDFLPRRSGRSRKQTGYRTELGTYSHKPIDWDTEEVADFMRQQGFADYADAFQECDINGQSMFLLKEHHLLERFSMKLGPALRVLDTISRLRHPPVV